MANYLWFLDTLVTVRISRSDGSDKISILEHRAAQGNSPPLHIHHTEDEIFHVIDGRFRFVVGDVEHQLGPGDFLHTPKGVPHQYVIESPDGGRWQTITTPGDFERFVLEVARPAERAELPEPSGPPPPEAVAALTETAARFGIEIVGPPLH